MSPPFDFVATSLITGLTKAVLNGSRRVKILFVIGALMFLVGMVMAILADSNKIPVYFTIVGVVLLGTSVIILIGIYASQLIIEETEAKAEIRKVEERIKENPNEPTAAWELARIKLENYLNRNLFQIRWIFIWTVIIMIAGFIILGYGIIKVYEVPSNISGGLITTISGLIIEFIGATFLVVYKSTMGQAKDFVNVLERINAVGMSVQILDRIEEDQKLKNQTGAEIAKLLLDLYGIKK